MRYPKQPVPHRAQAGGVTILVALMMLVLLTIASVGMSRSSFREIISSGFGRQGAMARGVADSGLEWSLYWLDLGNSQTAAGSANDLATLKATLLLDDTLSGVAKAVHGGANYMPGGTVPADLAMTGPTGVTEGYTLGLTRMGKLPLTGISQGSGPGAFAPATGGVSKQLPDLWAVRSDAQIVQGGVTFTNAKEAWISTPVQ